MLFRLYYWFKGIYIKNAVKDQKKKESDLDSKMQLMVQREEELNSSKFNLELKLKNYLVEKETLEAEKKEVLDIANSFNDKQDAIDKKKDLFKA